MSKRKFTDRKYIRRKIWMFLPSCQSRYQDRAIGDIVLLQRSNLFQIKGASNVFTESQARAECMMTTPSLMSCRQHSPTSFGPSVLLISLTLDRLLQWRCRARKIRPRNGDSCLITATTVGLRFPETSDKAGAGDVQQHMFLFRLCRRELGIFKVLSAIRNREFLRLLQKINHRYLFCGANLPEPMTCAASYRCTDRSRRPGTCGSPTPGRLFAPRIPAAHMFSKRGRGWRDQVRASAEPLLWFFFRPSDS